MSKLKIPTNASDSSSEECPNPFEYVPLCKTQTPSKNCPRKNSSRKKSLRMSSPKINHLKNRKDKPMKKKSPVKLDAAAKKKVWGPIDKYIIKKSDTVKDNVNDIVNEMVEINEEGMEDDAVKENNMEQEDNMENEANLFEIVEGNANNVAVQDGAVQEHKITSTSY